MVGIDARKDESVYDHHRRAERSIVVPPYLCDLREVFRAEFAGQTDHC